MNAGTTLVACVLTSVKTPWGPTSVAVPQASSWPMMAETVMVWQAYIQKNDIVHDALQHICLLVGQHSELVVSEHVWLCVDLNECESNPCSQECANVYGSYQCYCRRGYQLSDNDGVTCEGKMVS